MDFSAFKKPFNSNKNNIFMYFVDYITGMYTGPGSLTEDCVYPSILQAASSQEWPNSSMPHTQSYFCLLAMYVSTEVFSNGKMSPMAVIPSSFLAAIRNAVAIVIGLEKSMGNNSGAITLCMRTRASAEERISMISSETFWPVVKSVKDYLLIIGKYQKHAHIGMQAKYIVLTNNHWQMNINFYCN